MNMLILIFLLLVGMVGSTFLSKSEKYKHLFANTGLETFRNVQYTSITGGKGFLGRADDDEFLDDKSGDGEMMAYNVGNSKQDINLPTYASEEDFAPRGVETAAANVPRLAAPPAGGTAQNSASNDLDLL